MPVPFQARSRYFSRLAVLKLSQGNSRLSPRKLVNRQVPRLEECLCRVHVMSFMRIFTTFFAYGELPIALSQCFLLHRPRSLLSPQALIWAAPAVSAAFTHRLKQRDCGSPISIQGKLDKYWHHGLKFTVTVCPCWIAVPGAMLWLTANPLP